MSGGGVRDLRVIVERRGGRRFEAGCGDRAGLVVEWIYRVGSYVWVVFAGGGRVILLHVDDLSVIEEVDYA